MCSTSDLFRDSSISFISSVVIISLSKPESSEWHSLFAEISASKWDGSVCGSVRKPKDGAPRESYGTAVPCAIVAGGPDYSATPG